MKKSIRRRVAIAFTGLMIAALLAVGVINLVFSDDFYLREKQQKLKKSWEMFNQEVVFDESAGEDGDEDDADDADDAENADGTEEDGTGRHPHHDEIFAEEFEDVDPETEEDLVISDDLEQFCEVNALTYAVTDYNLNFLLTNARDGDSMASRLFGNLFNIEGDNTTVLSETDYYKIIKIHDSWQNMDYLELWGTLDCGDYYIALTPLESISDAARLSVRLYMYIGLIVILVSVFFVWLMTRRLVRPLRELTALSQRMAKLDFDAHYESGGEDEIGVLGANFNTMSYQLEQTISELKSANLQLQKDIDEKTKIDQMRREFLGNVSHELKTPIALIQGYAEGLKDIADDPESREFYCDVIIDESAKMNEMVKQLLTLNQLESGAEQLQLQRFDLTALIRGVIAQMQIMINQNQADVHFDEPGPIEVWADEFRIEEVVTNYLSNAIHHLDGDRRIEITCTVTKKTDKGVAEHTTDHASLNAGFDASSISDTFPTAASSNLVTVSVFNRGKPIPAEDIDRIWEKFYKVDKAHTRAYGGSGIGLSIVKAIMEQHGQTCRAENRADGVVFSFTLDCK